MIFFENQAATLSVFPERKLAFTEWKGFAAGKELLEVLDNALKIIEEYEIHFWLNDNRNMKVVKPADQEYINTKWFPQFVQKSKVLKSATIESDDIFNKISMENILRNADKIIPFSIKFFKTLEEAIIWLGVDIGDIDLLTFRRSS